MELRGDKNHSGELYLKRTSAELPWDYWIGLSLWTGEYLYFRLGEDFRCSVESFRNMSRKAAKVRGLEHKASVKNLSGFDIKVLWFSPIAERDKYSGEIPRELMEAEIHPALLQDPEFRRELGLEE